jgi:DNA (cytosine-5)-methyltransferase 1
MSKARWPFYEFFAGGGMARLGLGPRWHCVFANEICEKKARAYRMNFGPSPELRVCDVRRIKASELPAPSMLAWGSFPCQDLSLAGNGAGLSGDRSGAFVPFWKLVDAVRPAMAVLENVAGSLSSNGSRDFQAILRSIAHSGYKAGGLMIDAERFVPQSRPRLFIVAVRQREVPEELMASGPSEAWHPPRLLAAVEGLPQALKRTWIWWRLPVPPPRSATLANLIETNPCGSEWHSAEQTARLITMMSPRHLDKLARAQAIGERVVGTAYKRIRRAADGSRVQRVEVRFDGVSGCLRTPTGGSSRQTVLIVEGECVRSRLLSPREAARLMGLPDAYRLPDRYNEAYHVAGDGLAAPAVSWLERNLLSPLAQASSGRAASE